MISYLLLRNNKESGPFSLDELVRNGLKAYDLIWVNGKSAGWRYPSEIAELKEYAPVVEEQPYDRFFKKNSEEKKEEIISQPAPVIRQEARIETPIATAIKQEPRIETPVASAINQEPRVETPRFETAPIVESPKYTPGKSVFVTMPGQKNSVTPVREPEPIPQAYERYQPQAPVREAPVVREATPIEDPLPAKTITITENPVTAEIKYSQPLDEIKEMYVKTLQDRRRKIANKTFLLQSAKKVAALVAIVGAGVLIGFTIKGNGNKKLIASNGSVQQQQQVPAQQTEPTTTTEEQTTNPDITEPVQDQQQAVHIPPVSNPGINKMTQSAPKENTNKEEEYISNEIPTVEKEKMVEKEKVAKTIPVTQEEDEEVVSKEPEPVDVNSVTGERSRKVRNTNQETESNGFNSGVNELKTESSNDAKVKPKAIVSKNLSKLVSVRTNAYKIVAFGGIRDLQVTVYNDSKYVLDMVNVELQYLKPSLEPFMTRNIQFRSVSPGGSMTVRLPDTNRGVSIRYRVQHILSTQMQKEDL